MLSADGSGVLYRLQVVIGRCGRYQAGVHSGFRWGGGQSQCLFREQQKRRARVGHHHGVQTCMRYRGYLCDCLPDRGRGDTLAFDLNDGDDFSCGCACEKACRRGGS